MLAVILSAVFASPYGHGEVIFEDSSLLPPRNFRFGENTKILYQDDFESQDPNWGANDKIPLKNIGNSPYVRWEYIGSNAEDADSLGCPGGNATFPHPSGSIMHIADGAGYGGGKALRWLVKNGCDWTKYPGSADLVFTDNTRKEIYFGMRIKIDPEFKVIKDPESRHGDNPLAKFPVWVAYGLDRYDSSSWFNTTSFLMKGGYLRMNNAVHQFPISYISHEDAASGRWWWMTVHIKLETCPTCNDGLREIWIDGNLTASYYADDTYHVSNKGNIVDNIYSIRLMLGNTRGHLGFACTDYCGFVVDDLIVSTEYIAPPGSL